MEGNAPKGNKDSSGATILALFCGSLRFQSKIYDY
jgi:hypothetical protein